MFLFFETSSTWFEDFAYDEVNDYYQYLSDWFNQASLSLNSTTNLHEYGSSIWLHYLTKRLETSVIVRRLWEQIEVETAISAMKNAPEAAPFNLPFEESIREFYNWVYFTGSRSDLVQSFDEGRNYPEVTFDGVIGMLADTTINGSLAPLASHYFLLNRQPNESLQLFLTVDDAQEWSLTGITASGDDYSIVSENGLANLNVPTQNSANTVAVVVTHIGLPQNPSISAYGL